MDSASEFLFGHDVKSLSSGLPYAHNVVGQNQPSGPAEKFVVAFAESQNVIASRSRVGWTWPLLEIFEDKSAKHMKIVTAYL